MAALLCGCACAAALGSCGGSEADGGDGPAATLHVTREFGRDLLLAEERAPLPSRPTVLRLLRDHADVKTRYSGRTIKAIDSLHTREEDDSGGHETSWALIVNGVEADVLPPEYRVYPGDVVQFDLRDWYATLGVRSTVGAFPETFTRGVFGKLFPVTVRCEKPASWACRHVERLLRRAGVPIDGSDRPRGELPPAGNPQRAEVLVGAWKRWRSNEWAARIDDGTRYSGVFARFSRDARSLRLFDWNAHHVRTEGAGTGLVAAQRPTEEDLQWVITGVDDAGVERAARALGSNELRDAFAAAVTADGVQKLPLPPPRR
jgi:hypothetical protein